MKRTLRGLTLLVPVRVQYVFFALVLLAHAPSTGVGCSRECSLDSTSFGEFGVSVGVPRQAEPVVQHSHPECPKPHLRNTPGNLTFDHPTSSRLPATPTKLHLITVTPKQSVNVPSPLCVRFATGRTPVPLSPQLANARSVRTRTPRFKSLYHHRREIASLGMASELITRTPFHGLG